MKFVTTFLLVFLARGVFAEEGANPKQCSLKEEIDRIIVSSKIQDRQLAVSIYDIRSENTVYGNNADMMMNIASVSKIFTAYAALEFLGVARVFETEVFYDGKNLYLKGGGDPSLDTSALNLIAFRIKESGIKKIKSIVLDDSLFDGEIFPPMYGAKKSDAYYRAPVSALSVNSNTVEVTIKPSKIGTEPDIFVVPKSEYIQIENIASTIEKADSQLKVNAMERDGKTVIRVYGEIYLKSEPVVAYKLIYHPALNTGYHFAALLKSHGIAVKEVKRGITPGSAASVLKHVSKPLREIVSDMLKHSSNFIAETLLKHLGSETGQPGNYGKGIEKIVAILEKAGIGRDEIVLKNGSGLYDANFASSGAIVKFLSYAEKEKRLFPEFLSSLPVAGTDGTLLKRFAGAPLKGLVRAKTGTLNDVRALAGYLFGAEGGFFAFALLMNCRKCEKDQFYKIAEEILTAVSSNKCDRGKEGYQQQ